MHRMNRVVGFATVTLPFVVSALVSGLGCDQTPNDGDGGADGRVTVVDAAPPDVMGPSADAEVCAQSSAQAQLIPKPVDIVFVIDNSDTMGQEIEGVQDNINANFAQVIEESGVDYRVIMLARHGELSAESVCIESPLSGIPAGGCASPPAVPSNNPPVFYHFSQEVGSHDSWCLVLDTFTNPDEHGMAPDGYQQWLRPDAFKIFVEVTDDGVSCWMNGEVMNFNDHDNESDGQTAADKFDAALLALSPTHFGTAEARNYRWYSLVALANKDPANPAEAWLPSDPLTTDECPTAVAPGTGYQALSVSTGGLRFPLCEPDYYDVVFHEIAQGVIEGAAVSCDFAIPDPPPGEILDLDTVEVHYTPNGMGDGERFEQVADGAACAVDRFYIADERITLCPDACARVQADDTASIDIRFGCAVIIE